MDAIFKALNDPARRALLDSLRQSDGQTLTDLSEQLEMTRFGVMKHLKVLEDAQLIVTRKAGRFKHHYLNALPLQEVMDRWIHPFLQPQAQALSRLKATLEGQTMTKPDFMMATFINCSHDALWEALTKGDLIAQYHFACETVTGDMQKNGDTVAYLFPHGAPMLSNRVISITPKTRIEMAFLPSWGGDETPSRCVYLLEPTSTGMKLTVEHFDLPAAQTGVAEGWARFASGLKTWLETGQTHRFAPEKSA
ncbi:ArsR/SmtB family transcription factor [Thalassococcus sp. BH17M4-6]|uniref:ArsR/SmtB family transcription factor n=1 Tax=Thalassococcus sp. BH17M4-6 TaxID=3413148 RepID=UPI003BC68537